MALTRWHHDVVLEDGTVYPLRHRLEDGPEYGAVNGRALGLTAAQSRTGTAVHELGHALVWLAGGLHVTGLAVGTEPGGRAQCTLRTHTPEHRAARVIGIVAGERAVDRWLRETGLWTPSLAAMAELEAAHDRALVLDATRPRPAFGDGGPDYSDLHHLADQALDTIWDRLLTALPVLVRDGEMTGDRLAARTGLTNPSL
ncbi:hypothetical protein [Streptomyces anulatus]|uniref:hypothetical protein n=1 Tax=Streptomyces anulatus TaxID=1892 RepID=UPI001D1872D4|nr:hypothetical protein [Streptomyces anulatus]